jgi:hypothetical protein
MLIGRDCAGVRKSGGEKYLDCRKLTLASLLSLPCPNTKFGRVGSPSGLGPPEVGVGIGEGECAGDATRGFCAWMFKLPCAGEACAGAGELPMEPNLMPAGGMPVVGGVCLMCTEDLRLWSPLPLGPPTMAGMAGMAGLMAVLPFTGDTEELFPCCAPGPPTATGGAPLDAMVGEDVF